MADENSSSFVDWGLIIPLCDFLACIVSRYPTRTLPYHQENASCTSPVVRDWLAFGLAELQTAK
jgi:hypothetical protein